MASLGEKYFRRVNDAAVSLHCFVLGLMPAACELLLALVWPQPLTMWTRVSCSGAVLLLGLTLVICLFPLRSHPNYTANGKRALLLGCVAAVGIMLIRLSASLWNLGLYLVFTAIFHWSEYYATALTNPSNLRISSYILDHSTEYKIAALFSWGEFVLESWFLSADYKLWPCVVALGFLICFVGEALRKAAMWTARTNFNHLIEYYRRRDHELVTSGVYAWCRHPAYVGWFWWAIGTQLLLCNPISLILYAAAAWHFFYLRIADEEVTLINFFGQDYLQYQKRVVTGIPFIKGYRPPQS